jgi:hypothetical protein
MKYFLYLILHYFSAASELDLYIYIYIYMPKFLNCVYVLLHILHIPWLPIVLLKYEYIQIYREDNLHENCPAGGKWDAKILWLPASYVFTFTSWIRYIPIYLS